MARSLYNQHQLATEYKLPLADAAQIVDVPAYTWAYASVLHDAGIKYFVAASNSWRAPIMLLGRWNEKSPFYWEGPDGGRVLMWYSRAYLQAHTLFAGPWRMEAVRDSLPVFLQAYTRPDYTANTAIIFGTQLENTALANDQSEIVATFNREYSWPKLNSPPCIPRCSRSNTSGRENSRCIAATSVLTGKMATAPTRITRPFTAKTSTASLRPKLWEQLV